MKNNLPAGVRILLGVLSVILCIVLRQVLVLVGSVSIGVTVLGLVLIIGGIVLGSILKKRA